MLHDGTISTLLTIFCYLCDTHFVENRFESEQVCILHALLHVQGGRKHRKEDLREKHIGVMQRT